MANKPQEQEDYGIIEEGKLCLFAFFEKSVCTRLYVCACVYINSTQRNHIFRVLIGSTQIFSGSLKLLIQFLTYITQNI